MAFTADDQATVEQALLELALGKRMVSMTISGKVMQFGQANISELGGLLSQIKTEVAASAATPSYILTTTGKGL